jgi:hypothetical protein
MANYEIKINYNDDNDSFKSDYELEMIELWHSIRSFLSRNFSTSQKLNHLKSNLIDSNGNTIGMIQFNRK